MLSLSWCAINSNKLIKANKAQYLLWPPYVIGGAIIFLPCGFFCLLLLSSSFSSPNLSHRRLDVYHTFHTWCGLSANLRCRSETCCTRLAENTGRKKSSKIRHLGTIAQLCWAITSQLRHVSTIGKKLVKQQYLLHMFPQYGELWPTSGWDRSGSLGHPCKFQLVSRLGSITARISSSGHQPNFAALNRGRHLYSARRPSHWALAHILLDNSNSSITVSRLPVSIFIELGNERYSAHKWKH